MILLLALLQAKHFGFDFGIQPRWMHQNKGTFGHPGGIVHALLQAIPTALILLALGIRWETAVLLAIAEFVIHYAIDFAKVKITRLMGWVPIPPGPYRWPQSEAFWIFLGFDQLLHQATYIWIIWMVSP